MKKVCPLCDQQESATVEFGVCRARKDGRNLYCKACIRKKVTASRRALKEYRATRKRYLGMSEPVSLLNSAPPAFLADRQPPLTPTEAVRNAIQKGARTQREIAQETRLSKYEIGDVLANLLLWTREIRTQIIDNARHYFIREDGALPIVDSDDAYDIARKPDLPASFSSMRGLMPGRKAG